MARVDEAAGDNFDVIYHLRDINIDLCNVWKHSFSEYTDTVKVSHGDIFIGAPAVDAIVSPANSFGFMDGALDRVYSEYFGWQLQDRLQNIIRQEFDCELPVGQAIILTTYESEQDKPNIEIDCNEGQVIEYLISAPTMRVPGSVSDTVNAYLAFRAVILAGLATAVGKMPKRRCAFQMLQAYETFVKCKHTFRKYPVCLGDMYEDTLTMTLIQDPEICVLS